MDTERIRSNLPPVCDYEGSDYRTRFWENQNRDYEDQVERVALRRLLPPTGDTLIDIGAGFGRLANEFTGYQRIVLFDYSRSLLREARNHIGDDPRFRFVSGNWYAMPFVEGLFSTLVQVRTLHHAADIPALFRELSRIARPGADYVLEFANKHNLKAMARYWLGRQSWSPFAPEPVEFAALNFDFHPRWIMEQLQLAGFIPGERLTVSHFRFGPLKKAVPTRLLVAADSLAQKTGNWWQLSPSVFVHSRFRQGVAAQPGLFFACPVCQTPLNDTDGEQDQLLCSNPTCGRAWRVENRLYDFKEPV